MADLQLRWETTDPEHVIEVGQYNGYTDAKPVSLLTSYRNFSRYLSTPDPGVFTKNGKSFLIGPCRGRRAAKNIPHGECVVLDGDKSITEDKEVVDGAPDPLLVHNALVSWNISHILYTTHSHGGEKGNRYRVVFPGRVETKEELKAFVVYIVELLQVHANIPIALSSESFVWGQGWHTPRVPYAGAEFIWREHWGVLPKAADLVPLLGFDKKPSRMPKGLNAHSVTPNSPIGMIDKCMPVQWQLDQHGYEFVSQGIMTDSNGAEVPVMRYRKPGSKSAPGVAVFYSEDRWRVYSHHANDILNNGQANDALDLFKIFNALPTTGDALRKAVPYLQEFVAEDMNKNFPSVLDGGVKYKYGNICIDDLGCIGYKFLDSTTFLCMMQNRPGVPVLVKDKEGKEGMKMINQAEYWRTCRDRVLYNDTTYLPCPITKKPELSVVRNGSPYFNLFRDWNIKPRKGNWPLLDWHLKYAICGGVEEEYIYLKNWFSHLFQFPHEKPAVAMVLQGGRGWGKSILFSELAKQLGSHAIVVGNNRLLTGNFNAHMRNKLLTVVEESFWSGNHKERGVLQHLISDSLTTFERKGIDAEVGLSFTRAVLLSNEDWVAPAATDERRYFLPSLTDCAFQADLSPSGKKGKYFPSLALELEHGGLDAFIYDMATREFDKESVKNVPATEKLISQKKMSLDWVDQWLLQALEDGMVRSEKYGIVVWSPSGCIIDNAHLTEALKEVAPPHLSANGRGLSIQAGHRFNKVLGRGARRKVSGPNGSRTVFSALDVCRIRFETYCGFPIEWELPSNAVGNVPGEGGTKHEPVRH